MVDSEEIFAQFEPPTLASDLLEELRNQLTMALVTLPNSHICEFLGESAVLNERFGP
jgi:hypothetical protein